MSVTTRSRKLALLASLALAGAAAFACANPNAPPGGPPDADPPVLMKVSPGNGTVGAKPKSVVFQFNEVISETPKGAQNLASLVFISPKSGDPEVSWRRSSIDVKPRKGWKPNTVYSITLGAGVMDLHNNSIDSAMRLVFSTGGPIPSTRIDGVAFDWQLGKYAPKAIVEAIAPGRDSVTYQTIADSTGHFLLEHLPPGPYTVRAFVDRNNNRTLDGLEPWDTAGVTLTSTASQDLYAFAHDTIGLRIADVVVIDSGTRIKLTFDKPVGLGQAFNSTQFALQKADSTTLGIATVFTAPAKFTFDSLQRKAHDDSVARAAPPPDTSAAGRARRDTLAQLKRRDSLAVVQRAAAAALAEARRIAALPPNRRPPPKDTTPPPKMKRPTLFTELYLTLEKPLEYNTNYRLTARSVRSLSGTVKSPTRVFRSPPKPTPRDTTKTPKAPARVDTTAPKPAAPKTPARGDTAQTRTVLTKR